MSEFKVLTDQQHVRMRTGMYAGSTIAEPVSGIINFKYQSKTVVPALIKCVEEIYQNSIDEWIRTNGKFANKISVTIENTIDGTEIVVSDNGRGIPVKPVGNSYQPVLAWTELRAGSNFDDSAGRITAGSHGMGSSIVNILSDSFIGITDDGENRCTVTCSDGMSNIDYKITPSKMCGTTVKFVPSLSHFGLQEFTLDHIDIIRDRITNLAILYPAISFSFNGENIAFKNLKYVAKQFHESAISFEDKNISMVFSTSGDDEEFRGHCYINGIYVKNGGSPVDYVMNRVIETLRTVITKKHKISVLPNQIRQHLLFACWISEFKNLKFDSQTKERITNSQAECSAILGHIDYEAIAKKILNTPEIVDPMISAILYKKELADRLALAKATKDSDRANLRKIVKFTDASNKTDRMNCILGVCEGDSANNSLLSARTEYVGSYPLKGKPINVMGATIRDIMNNKEFVDLLTITGLKIGEPVKSLDQLRFGKIAIISDQDQDGSHIAGLLCTLFKKFWPELFSLGAIYRFITPITKVEIGKTTKFFYTLDEFNVWAAANKGKKYVSRYLKGLGSSTAKDFAYYFENMEKHLIQITVDDVKDLDIVDLVFGKESGAADKRKMWLDLEEQHSN